MQLPSIVSAEVVSETVLVRIRRLALSIPTTDGMPFKAMCMSCCGSVKRSQVEVPKHLSTNSRCTTFRKSLRTCGVFYEFIKIGSRSIKLRQEDRRRTAQNYTIEQYRTQMCASHVHTTDFLCSLLHREISRTS